MVFKLVRTDTEEPCKIQLPLGTHMIGRGKFLECDDKRVSRNHGELQVTDDAVIIKALHQNPCFYMKKGTEETEVLKRDCTADLGNGDKFGLLPGSYWYEILHCTSIDIPRKTEVTESQETVVLESTILNENSTQNDLYEQEENEARVESPSMIQRNEPLDQSMESPSLIQRNESQSLNQSIESQSLIQRSDSSSLAQRPESPSLTPRDSSVSAPTTDQSPTQEYPDQPEEPKTPSKRRHSQDVDDSKRVKTDPVEVKQEPVEVKQEPGVTPGPCNDQAGPSNDNADSKDLKVGQPATAPTVGRERCMYGANCYRKNPQHKAQFSHPTDADWGAGPRGVCPWGAGCARRDARHWRDHDHPPGVNRKPSPRPVQRRKRRSSSEDNTPVLPDTSLIVAGKRPRKQKQRVDNWSGSETDDDPYQTDDSDEWQPDSRPPLSDYTQTQD